jgi:hypothetical protein
MAAGPAANQQEVPLHQPEQMLLLLLLLLLLVMI